MAFACAAQGQRAVAAVTSGAAAFASEMFNRYDGAQPSSPERSYSPAFVRDARFDATSMVRWELNRKVRDYERNIWLVKKNKEVYTKYTVGPRGLQVIPASSDTEWNKRMLAAYQQWCESPILDSSLPMSQAHKLMSGDKHLVGGMFILKTSAKKGGKGPSIPKIQLIESHRCSSPGTLSWGGYGMSEAVEGTVIDGVGVDDNGKPVEYWMRDGLEGDAWLARPASQVIHVFTPGRVGEYREYSPYHAVMNTTTDLADLEALEMQRAKANAEEAKIFKTWNGEMDPNMSRQQRGYVNRNAPVPVDNDLQKRIEQLRPILGARTIALRPGEEMQTPSNPSPSAAQQWYYRFKISQICSAVGIPMILVWPESIQGTVARAILDDANLFFQSEFNCFAHAAREIYRFFADWARYNVAGLQDLPGDWMRCHVIPPRACNVDIGRNSAAKIAELAVGFTSYDDEANAGGTISEEIFTRKARNIGRIKQIAAAISKEMEVEVSPAEIASPIADVLKNLAIANQAQATADSLEAGEEKPEPIEA